MYIEAHVLFYTVVGIRFERLYWWILFLPLKAQQ